MPWRLIARMLIVGGVILLLVSLAANPLGIGSNPKEFGWLQTLGSVLGCLAIAGGMRLTMRDE